MTSTADEMEDINRFPGADMTVREIEGYGYIGYLFIPDLGLELSVMSEWDEERLKIAPCRHFGSTWSDDLVIAGHNYQRQFGTLHKLGLDAAVFFTDMDGVVNTYKVKDVVVLQPTDIDIVRNSDWDLTLYTCTYGGQNRVVIGCDRVE